MPRALLRDILTEKKKELPIKTEGEFYAKLDALKSACFNVLMEVTSAENVVGKDNTVEIRKEIEKYLEEINTIVTDREKYVWDDESVQNKIVGTDGLESKIEKAFSSTRENRENLLGKNDSFKFANDYYELAEEQKKKGIQIIFNLASIESQARKGEEFRKTTDPITQNTLDTGTLDIVAKKGVEQKEGESDDDFKKRQEEQETALKVKREGIIKVIATLLGQTQEEIDKQYTAADSKDKLATRIELYNKVMPFVEAFTGRKYERCSKKEGKGVFDPQFVEDLSVLAEYRGYYKEKYAKSQREGEKKAEEFTEEDYKKIEKETKAKIELIKNTFEVIKKENGDSGDIKQKNLSALCDEAIKELDSLDTKATCSTDNLEKIKSEKEDLKSTIESLSETLAEEEMNNLVDVLNIIDKILDYCSEIRGE